MQKDALDFLQDRLQTDEDQYKYQRTKKYTWRHSAQGRFQHTLRVLYHAKTIMEEVPCDKDVVEMSAILHDIAKIYDEENHGERGAWISRKYLEKNGYSLDFTKKVADCIRLHTMKGKTPFASVEAKVLQDADLLDQRYVHGMLLFLREVKKEHTDRMNLEKTYHPIPDLQIRKYVDKANFPFVGSEIQRLHQEVLKTSMNLHKKH
ncbi:MAG: HD domain-containing protein [Bacillota bacterium]